MQDLEPDVLVLVVSKFKYSLPELWYVSLHMAWAHFLNSSHLDLLVLVLGEFNQFFDVLSCRNLVKVDPNFFLRYLNFFLRVDLRSLVSSFLTLGRIFYHCKLVYVLLNYK